jgi:hypothetical protein
MSSGAISKLYNEKLNIEDKILKEKKLKKRSCRNGKLNY